MAEDAFDFLERLVSAPSTVGHEAEAQIVVARELDRLGFTTAQLPVSEEIGSDPAAGVPQASYARHPGRLPSGVDALRGHEPGVGRARYRCGRRSLAVAAPAANPSARL
ncbi:MAG TPA: hypothetical protein VIV12_02045, partial [Streptosporangiaceae bacterium]